jgi:hypothetical protein
MTAKNNLTKEERHARAIAFCKYMVESSRYSSAETEILIKDSNSKLRQYLDEFRRLDAKKAQSYAL